MTLPVYHMALRILSDHSAKDHLKGRFIVQRATKGTSVTNAFGPPDVFSNSWINFAFVVRQRCHCKAWCHNSGRKRCNIVWAGIFWRYVSTVSCSLFRANSQCPHFQGIPYAEPPLGKLRLQPPVRKFSLDVPTLDASEFGVPCLQAPAVSACQSVIILLLHCP